MKTCTHKHSHERQDMSSLTNRLRRGVQKITGPRAAILEILRQHPHPLTNKEIFASMPKNSCDLATIYRSMHLLEKIGMVKRFQFHDGAARFELMAEGDDGHHHHLVCTMCAEAVKIGECLLPDIEKKIAALNGFKSITHRLEFFGICPACQK